MICSMCPLIGLAYLSSTFVSPRTLSAAQNDQKSDTLLNYIITSKIPVRWPGQCYGFTLSLIFKYSGGIGLY